MQPLKVAVIDDTKGLALRLADWSRLDGLAAVEDLGRPFADEDEVARTLAPFDVVVPTRERAAFPASLVEPAGKPIRVVSPQVLGASAAP